MLASKIPVAAIQPRAHNRDDFEIEWPRIVRQVRDAAERGARLIVLPEATVPGYVLGTVPVRPELLERAAADLCAVARRYATTIVYGSAKIVEGRTYNAAICIGPDGTELGHAAKQFLWHFDRRWFAPGEHLQPIETPLGTLGLLVCADGRIPTIAATLVERGAQLLVMPTAWVTSGRDPGALENVQADLMANVRARENRVPFVVANKCGVELESVAYCGKSAIVDADGAFVARAGETHEDVVFGEVTLAPHDGDARRARAHALAVPEIAGERERARVAFTSALSPSAIERFATLAADADCDLVIARGTAATAMQPPVVRAGADAAGTHVPCAGVVFAIADDATMHDPRGLVEARLAGTDFVVWCADATGDADWRARIARTRAAELRAFVLVFVGDTDRAFVVDPDGVVVAGTFGDFRMASFVYDRARTRATVVAPTTDVFAGLRTAEAIRAAELRAPVRG